MPAQFTSVDQLAVATPDEARAIKQAAMGVGAVPSPDAVIAPGAEELVVAPGVDRWPVKTGTDDDVGQVKAKIVDTTVEELIRLPRPNDMVPPTAKFPKYQSTRATPTEATVWRLTADVIAIKEEADGDYHLVLQGASGETMIAEIPLPKSNFVASTSPWFADIKAARAAADTNLVQKVVPAGFLPMNGMLMPPGAFTTPPAAPPQPPQSFVAPVEGLEAAAAQDVVTPFKTKVKPTTAVVTGVGFFDAVHGQSGVAPNTGIELHPVLKIEFK